jgi:hypothetical protein
MRSARRSIVTSPRSSGDSGRVSAAASGIQVGIRAAGTEAPDLRRTVEMRTRGLESIHALGRKDNVIGMRDVDAVGE